MENEQFEILVCLGIEYNEEGIRQQENQLPSVRIVYNLDLDQLKYIRI